jgi:hypothetical protein
MENNLFNFIMTLYFGFLMIFVLHPRPKIISKKVYLKNCDVKNGVGFAQKMCTINDPEFKIDNEVIEE